MTDALPGTVGPREPDSRFSSAHCAFWSLLGRPGSGAESDHRSGWKYFYAGNAECRGGRSAAMAGARLDRDSCTNDFQDGLEINWGAREV